MASYWIGYDLKEGEDYQDLISEIKSLSIKWWHYLDSTWIVTTSLDVNQITDRLKEKMNLDHDRLLVMKTSTDRQGWLPEKAWDWIRDNVTD